MFKRPKLAPGVLKLLFSLFSLTLPDSPTCECRIPRYPRIQREADAALIAVLGRRTSTETFDEQPIPDLDSESIDFAVASQSFAERRSLRRQDLEALGLVSRRQGRTVPTVGGLLLFGRGRLSRYPDAWIQAGRFAGTDRTELVDRANLTDYPVTALEQAVSFVERNTRLGMSIGRLQRREVPAVPPAALREALVNAVVHADYAQRGAPIRVAIFDDRVEVENPGILLAGLTTEELREGLSRMRNRVLARVFNELGLIEQWGTGVQRKVDACTRAGLPEPEFAEVGLRFRVILRTEPIGPATFDAIEKRILDYVAEGEGRSTAAIARHVGPSTRATQHRLAELEQRGLIAVVGSGLSDPRRRLHSARKSAAP